MMPATVERNKAIGDDVSVATIIRLRLGTSNDAGACLSAMHELAALLEPQIPALRRYAWALLRDDEAADDLVQDTLERTISRWALRRRGGDLRAWLFTIERNLFVSSVRQRTRRGPTSGRTRWTQWPRGREARIAKWECETCSRASTRCLKNNARSCSS